ncbi:MAG: amidohydrolase [Defluviitaleaceae bacterium]|nr:amidohydrolase [Defluviitaleaceae bacterium]
MGNVKIIDSHVHIRSRTDGHAPLFELAERLGYTRLAVMSLQCLNPSQNTVAAALKLSKPGFVYAFGGLDYVSGRDFRTQAENIYAMGFDGVKMLEGKPTVRRSLKMPLDSPDYDGFYSFLEEKGFPVVMHVADPDTFWDEKRAPEFAAERGWLYGADDVPYERYYAETEKLLGRYPRLRVIFAHFYFLSWDAERAQKFLDRHPNVYFDVTAGIEMYENFSLDPAFWRGFFVKNKDRIIFGTDSSDEKPSADTVSLNGYAGMEIEFLKNDGPVEVYGMKLHGLGLPEDAQAAIFAENFLRLAGDPRTPDIAALKKEAEYLSKYADAEQKAVLKLAEGF